MQFWEQHLYNLGSYIACICFGSLGTHQRWCETSWGEGSLVLLCIISINVFTSFLSFWGSTQVCSNAPETWQRLLQGWRGEGREGGNGEVSPGFRFQDKNFLMSNSSQPQEPLDNIRNPKSRVCVQDRRCQAEERDSRQRWGTGCCACQRTGRAYWKPVGSTHPDVATFSSRAGDGEEGVFEGRQSSGTSLAAGPRFPGAQLGTAGHIWPAAAWEPPAARGAPAAGPRCRRARRQEPRRWQGAKTRKELHRSLGAAKTRPRLKSRALIKLMACLACNLSSWVSASLWSNRFT